MSVKFLHSAASAVVKRFNCLIPCEVSQVKIVLLKNKMKIIMSDCSVCVRLINVNRERSFLVTWRLIHLKGKRT